MMGPKRYVKDWFARKEGLFPGFTYFALGFWMLCFYTPLMTTRYLGSYSRLVDYAVFALGMLTFFVIYREELREAFQNQRRGPAHDY